MYERRSGPGRNPATNPAHPECKRKRGNQGRAMSRGRKRKGLPPKRRPDRADALDIAWRSGRYLNEVERFLSPPKKYDTRQEAEKRALADIDYSTEDDERAVMLWFTDTREPKGGPETGRTSSRTLAVIGSARPWWESETACTRGPAKPL
ncbi:hypothetical protein ACIQHY_21155 [Streptomyces sp. NPDC092359]|uniref:hypothetical protein n=1 Tax=Streptomyces sp. NPDC092359 TaxID=3366014 RepID=UPI0037F6FFA5